MRYAVLFALLLAGCAGEPAAERPEGGPTNGDTALAPDPSGGAPADTPPGAPEASCGITSDARLGGEGIGAFTIGTAAAALRTDCAAATESTIRDVEGMEQRVIDLARPEGMIRAEIVDDAVWRVRVTDPSITTTGGVSVGSTLGDLLEHEGARGMMGEGKLYVALPDHCGTSFGLDTAPGDISRAGDWTNERLRELPASTPVDEILAFGC